MPLIELKRNDHECWPPMLGLNPRTFLWGLGTIWQCSKCSETWEIRYDHHGYRYWMYHYE